MQKITRSKLLKIAYILMAIILLSLSSFAFLHYYYNRPPQRALFIKPIYKFDTEEKIVALTFDDGPSKERTPRLLDLLKEQDVKVTFFMVGENIEKHKDIAQRAVEEGHLVANHSYSHPRLILKTPGFVKNEIVKTDDLLREVGVEELKYFRPPYGDKMVILPLVLKDMDKELVTYTYGAFAEYDQNLDGNKVADQVIENIKPGSIVVLHDGRESGGDEFILAIERIIVELREEGYRFVTIDEGIT